MLQLRLCARTLLTLSGVALASPVAAVVAYHDVLANGFADWSWPAATHNFANPSPARDAVSIRMVPANWSGVFLHAPAPLQVVDYEAVRFWIHGGGATGHQLRLHLQLGGSSIANVELDGFYPGGQVPAGSWAEITVPFAALAGLNGVFDGIVIMADQVATQPAVYLDDIEVLVSSTPPPPPTPIAVSVDPWADRRPINPLIYGVNFGEAEQVARLRYPLRRWGGNATTRYNWQLDIGNRASDYFFQNVPEGPDPGTLPLGSTADQFVAETQAAGGATLITVPTIGWTAKPAAPPSQPRDKSWSFSVAKYGPQQLVECQIYNPPPGWCSWDAGNGVCDPAVNTDPTRCDPATGFILNDPNDASQPVTPAYVEAWVDHLTSQFGTATAGGVEYYALDNEPMLWDSTHRDVHPDPATYDEVWSNGLAVARAIKQSDPGAKVLGPVTWGWCDLFASAVDNLPDPSDFNNCTTGPDRTAHGGKAFVPWYLEQICAAPAPRPVDVLDIHYYPQGAVAGLGDSSSEDAATAARRLRSLRELYDPTWVAESWVGDTVRLIPRLREWIDQECPGIELAITEYKWGADDGPSGALAQAEVLAIFGREGVDLATRWVAPEPGSLSEDAFELYLDYDGMGQRVSGDSVRASSANHEVVGAFGVRGTAGQLYVLLFNKDTQAREAQVAVANPIAAGDLALFRFAAGQPLAAVGNAPRTAGGFSAVLPARSATLVVVPLDLSGGLLLVDDFESGDLARWEEF